MKTVFCVFVERDNGYDPLLWICSSWDIAQSNIDEYGHKESSYYIQEEILEEVMAGKVVA